MPLYLAVPHFLLQIAKVRLDKFVHDPNKGTGSTVIEATRGTFRFTTGAQNAGQVQIKTPYGVLGARG